MKLGINKAFNLLADKLQDWVEIAIKSIPNLIAAIIILIVFYGIGWLIRKFISKSLSRITNNQAVTRLLVTISGVIVIAIGIFIALGVLQLGGVVTSLLAGAGVIGLALGFAFQDTASNLISGIILSIRHPFGINDIIECNDHYGYVHDINLRCTIIRDTQGYLIYIPNKTVLNKSFINYTWNGARRLDIKCGCSQADDLREVRKVAKKAIESIDSYNSNREVEVFFKEFGASSMNFVVRFWIHFKDDIERHQARNDAIIAMREYFDKNDIATPYPIRTIDYAMKGGKRLHEELIETETYSNKD